MASVGIRKRVTARTGRVTYQVWWLLDDGSQGAETVRSKEEARDLVAKKRLGITRGAWQGLQRGRLPFSWWAEQWWEIWAGDPDRSPTTLAVTESRLRLYVRPWFGQKPIKRIGPADIRRWQAHLASSTGHATLMQCRSLVLRILQFAVDEGAIDSNPARKVPSPRRRADPEQVLDQAKRRALTPEEAGRLLAQFPLFWWDHVVCLLGTGLRFGELAGLRRHRVHLDRALPVLQVVDTRYQAGRFGSGFKPRPKADSGIREAPLAPLVAEAIRRQLPPGSDPSALVFTGPGGGPGRHGGAGVPKRTRTVLSRYNFHRTYHPRSPSWPTGLVSTADCGSRAQGAPDGRPADHRPAHRHARQPRSGHPPSHDSGRPWRASVCRADPWRQRGRTAALVGAAHGP
jgi:integrase